MEPKNQKSQVVDENNRSEKLKKVMDTHPPFIVSKGIGLIILMFVFLTLACLLIPIFQGQTLWQYIKG